MASFNFLLRVDDCFKEDLFVLLGEGDSPSPYVFVRDGDGDENSEVFIY